MFRKRDEIDFTSRYHPPLPPPRGGCRLGFGGKVPEDMREENKQQAATHLEVMKDLNTNIWSLS